MEKVMIYPIVVFGAPVLREKCREIGPDYPEVKKLIEDMFLTLEEAEGVGLAAPQIGKSIRLFIVDCTPWGEDHPELADYRRAFINPEIYEVSEETKLYDRRELLYGHEANVRYVCTRQLTHLEARPFMSCVNRWTIGERHGYMSMVV